MKTIDEQDHYEVLEVPRNAGVDEIERAYKIARGTYSGDSLATYSVFDADDSQTISERIDLAYRVLLAPETRAEYDLSLGLEPGVAVPVGDSRASGIAEIPPDVGNGVSSEFDNLHDEAEEDGDIYSGARLRRARMRRGVEIERISEITKISVTYLRCIEEESFVDLPAEVYVRGFVTAYARTIGLDAGRVVPDYMARFSADQGQKRRGFSLSSR